MKIKFFQIQQKLWSKVVKVSLKKNINMSFCHRDYGCDIILFYYRFICSIIKLNSSNFHCFVRPTVYKWKQHILTTETQLNFIFHSCSFCTIKTVLILILKISFISRKKNKITNKYEIFFFNSLKIKF